MIAGIEKRSAVSFVSNEVNFYGKMSQDIDGTIIW
jgi:hypothetical protein